MLDEELQKKNTSDWLKIFAGRFLLLRFNDLQGALENPFVQDEGRIQSSRSRIMGVTVPSIPLLNVENRPPPTPLLF
jgi:vacuolar-type H+-ATPase subunit D/Vma8